MKQVLVRSGRVEVAEVPAPAPAPGRALVATAFSVISSGTEAAVLSASGRTVLERAAGHPSPLRRLGEVVRGEGVAGILRRLNRSAPGGLTEVGYAASGVVLDRGPGLSLSVGTRVACGGSQFAHHAELITVPENLMAPIPAGLPLEEAAFATLAAIALHGFHRSEAKLGETVAVIGLGLVGLMGGQIAGAAGCRVLAFDPNPERVALARDLGIEAARVLGEADAEPFVSSTTGGHGADVVLIFAASESNEPLELAMRLARKKGKVVIVGEVGMQADRSLLYPKELDLLISTSYGPGRYDPTYEEKGSDYPLPYVRWTEGRNLAAVLEMMARGQLRVKPLIQRIWPVAEAVSAYESLRTPGKEPAVLLSYDKPATQESASRDGRSITLLPARLKAGEVGVAVVGPGHFMREAFLPALKRHRDARLVAVVAGTGGSARAAAEQFGAEVASTDLDAVLSDPRVELVLIGTRHHLHAGQVVLALQAGKAVFVEKPLCIARRELEQIREARGRSGRFLCVGFNRRYAPLVREMKRRLALLPGPRVVQARVNAGRVSPDHWTQDPQIGGGRLIGEGCHFLDLIPFLAGAPIASLSIESVPEGPDRLPIPDNFALNLRLADGSLGTLLYTSLGGPSLPKERWEVHAGGSSLILEDFRDLFSHTGGKIRRTSRSQDKGLDSEVAALLAALRGDPSEIITWEEIEAATEWSLKAQELLEKGS
ncbi:MAG TPA: bi-domain-containing oxidoreductase [Candidatus Polarisedimenticolia bacterium]|nr:bi-domain-containing oxidoreductase [Candidatus Polarisedimenticolia bacterium]